MRYFRSILTLVLVYHSFSQFAKAQLPDSITIYDGSLVYLNSNEYSYVLKKSRENYTLYRTQTGNKPINLGTISFEVIDQLVAALDASYPTLSL
jgi:hypothetical protein